MVGGYNHNFRYKGEVYHVQTEDSGIARAQITTLLYRGGTILGRKTIHYQDLLGQADLPRLVEEQMKVQHKQMLQELKDGGFDERIAALDMPFEMPAEQLAAMPQPDEAEVEVTVEASSPPIVVSDATRQKRVDSQRPQVSFDDQVLAYLKAGRP
ncbi:MAG: hypothetical protein JXR59_09905 [Desulfuromonadaceae bacterium]|nr:hypothetical protein [Desulfuromonadaceae bacterium]